MAKSVEQGSQKSPNKHWVPNSFRRPIDRRGFLFGSTKFAAGAAAMYVTVHGEPRRASADQPATSANSTSPETTNNAETLNPPYTFKNLGNALGVRIGVLGEAGGNDPERMRILREEFNQIQVASIQMNTLQPNPNAYDFRIPDYYVKMAEDSGSKAQAMHLVWGFEGSKSLNLPSEIPSWLRQGVDSGQYKKDDLIRIMQDRIKTVMTRYKGRVKSYSVVNEAIGHSQNFWATNIGPEYVKLAFEAARDADPDAELILNDYGIEYPGAPNSNRVFDLVQNLNSERKLVDTVGMQMHFTGPPNLDPAAPPTKDQLTQEMSRYRSIGVNVAITELDVDTRRIEGTPEQKEQAQADIYKMVFEAALDSDRACTNLNVWGVNDQGSWMRDGSPLLYSNGQPKPVVEELKNLLLRRYQIVTGNVPPTPGK